MRKFSLGLILCAVVSAIAGCSSPGTSASNVNLSDLLSAATNATATASASIAQLEAAYNQFYPQYAQIGQIIAAWKTNAAVNAAACTECSDKSAFGKSAPGGRSAAVICGLTQVDPKKYNGWSGDCPGCDVDAQAFSVACQSEGVPYELMLNDQATFQGVLDSARRAAASLNSGDLLILYVSGHGGQTDDPAEASETDRKSETICLWDGQLIDNRVWSLLQQAKAKGLRVWMITDTCNSGTNYRSPHNYVRALAPRLSSDDPSLLHWGGCADGKSSFGGPQGGTFTTALVDSYKQGQTYAEWFSALARRMPFNQRPTREFTGADFQTLKAFR